MVRADRGRSQWSCIDVDRKQLLDLQAGDGGDLLGRCHVDRAAFHGLADGLMSDTGLLEREY